MSVSTDVPSFEAVFAVGQFLSLENLGAEGLGESKGRDSQIALHTHDGGDSMTVMIRIILTFVNVFRHYSSYCIVNIS
jgi:hypothetical protein